MRAKAGVVRVGIAGLGTVGRGVFDLLVTRRALVRKRTGIDLQITALAEKNRSIREKLKLPKGCGFFSLREIIEECDILVELIGGRTVAYELVEAALERGKAVVTANKALLAEKGGDIFPIARKHQAQLRYEASVAGGIPILKAIRESLVANEITEMFGIINGTANYVLSRMEEAQLEFSEALKEAQEQGFAELDPSFDVNGRDSAHKALLLAELAFGVSLPFEDVYVEGIENISTEDISYAKEMGYRIKLLAVIRKNRSAIEVRVHPALIPVSHPLAAVRNEFNAIFLSGNAVGEQLYFGKGAGRYPTASAVVADVVDAAKEIVFSETVPFPLRSVTKGIFPMEEVSSCYYLKFMTLDKPLVLAEISRLLGKYNISIASVIQKESKVNKPVPIVVTTHTAREADVRNAINEIDKLKVVRKKTVLLRIVEI